MTAVTEPRYRHPEAVVTTAQLEAELDDPALRVFDCTTYLAYETGTGRPYKVVSGRADYEAGHIPGSAFLDLQGELSDAGAPTAFMMLPPEDFAARIGRLGVGDGTRVVLYSRKSMQWATRLWWMLRSIGFDAAAILDGGWDKWQAEGRPVSAEPRRYAPEILTPRPRPGLFVAKEAVLAAIGDPGACTLNALSPELHRGDNSRYGRPGRIPGSVNVPAAALLDPETLALPPPKTAAAAFAAAGAEPSKRTILYCGGGIAATLDAFLMHQLGFTDLTVYDASMSEWAKDESLPIETG